MSGRDSFDFHAHSPQRTISTHAGYVQIGHASGSTAARRTLLGDGLSTLPSAPTPPVHSTTALSNGDDPFMGPSSAVSRWQGQTRSGSTDETMPDYASGAAPHRRTSTDMSGVSWPRRDFQRHMDEAAIDEIIEALSPEKRDRLKEMLSPDQSSSSGLHAPSNTPRTAEATKLPSPVINPKEGAEIKVAEQVRGSGSLESDESSGFHAGTSGTASKGSERAMITRSQKSKQAPLSSVNKRSRSTSKSSRKKRSLSPSANERHSAKMTSRISPNSDSSDKEDQRAVEDGDGVSITIE